MAALTGPRLSQLSPETMFPKHRRPPCVDIRSAKRHRNTDKVPGVTRIGKNVIDFANKVAASSKVKGRRVDREAVREGRVFGR